MHSITICFGPTGTVWNFMFKEKDAAETAYKKMATPSDAPCFLLEDDYGQTALIMCADVHGVLLEDMDLSQMAQVERGLHQARSQAKAQTRAMADPVIKESLRAQQQGPAVMSPMGNRFNG